MTRKELEERKYKINAMLYFNAVDPTNAVDKGKWMNLEKGYNSDAIRSEFNPDIRGQLAVSFKKVDT